MSYGGGYENTVERHRTEIGGDFSLALEFLTGVYAASGQSEKAKAMLADFIELSKRQHVCAYEVAIGSSGPCTTSWSRRTWTGPNRPVIEDSNSANLRAPGRLKQEPEEASMRAAWYERQGPAHEVLEVGHLDDPTPGSGEVRLRLLFSGAHPGDVKKRGDAFGTGMPYSLVIPHSDGAGQVDAVGDGVDTAWLGQRVWCFGAQSYRARGTAAELTVVPAEKIARLSDEVPLDQSASIGIPGITAHRAVDVAGPLAGKTVLVQGAAGTVGACAVHLTRGQVPSSGRALRRPRGGLATVREVRPVSRRRHCLGTRAGGEGPTRRKGDSGPDRRESPLRRTKSGVDHDRVGL